jgi:biopolymer transport protein ExbB/TolQ
MVWIVVVEWLARLIFLILIFLSYWSVSIILERKKFFKQLNLQILKDSLTENLNLYKNSELMEKAYAIFIQEHKKNFEKGLSILGTLGSTAPFIGLLGTVMGIIVSFGELSKGSTDTNSVMYSLSEALILTAVGLVVAIPAVISFNFYSKKMRSIFQDLNLVKDQLILKQKN